MSKKYDRIDQYEHSKTRGKKCRANVREHMCDVRELMYLRSITEVTSLDRVKSKVKNYRAGLREQMRDVKEFGCLRR